MKRYAVSIVGTKVTRVHTITMNSLEIIKAINSQEAKGKMLEAFIEQNEGFKIIDILTEEIK